MYSIKKLAYTTYKGLSQHRKTQDSQDDGEVEQGEINNMENGQYPRNMAVKLALRSLSEEKATSPKKVRKLTID
jgi:hypothetical protein